MPFSISVSCYSAKIKQNSLKNKRIAYKSISISLLNKLKPSKEQPLDTVLGTTLQNFIKQQTQIWSYLYSQLVNYSHFLILISIDKTSWDISFLTILALIDEKTVHSIKQSQESEPESWLMEHNWWIQWC